MSPVKPPAPPVLYLKIEPKVRADEQALRAALEELMKVDLDLSIAVDRETGETIIQGGSELHLDTTVELLLQRGIDTNVGAPQVAYRETLSGAFEIDYTHKQRTGGTDQFARVKLRVEPNEEGKGNEFTAAIVGNAVPEEYIPGIEKGVQAVWDLGVLIGFPVVDTKVMLIGGESHEVASSMTAFEIATRAAMKEACEKAGINLLEPVMDVEIETPGEFVGSIMGDVSSRRGQILNHKLGGISDTIRAYVPLAKLFGYASSLRGIASGRATHIMSFSHYQPVPRAFVPDPGTFPPAIGLRA